MFTKFLNQNLSTSCSSPSYTACKLVFHKNAEKNVAHRYHTRGHFEFLGFGGRTRTLLWAWLSTEAGFLHWSWPGNCCHRLQPRSHSETDKRQNKFEGESYLAAEKATRCVCVCARDDLKLFEGLEGLTQQQL
jgi:hypothetical protein